MGQPTLFDTEDRPSVPAHARHGLAVGAPFSNQTTSKRAAASISGILNDLQAKVLAFLRERGDDGATNEEIEAGTGLAGNCVRPRCLELREMNLVRDSGRERRTKAGRRAIVWEAVR